MTQNQQTPKYTMRDVLSIVVDALAGVVSLYTIIKAIVTPEENRLVIGLVFVIYLVISIVILMIWAKDKPVWRYGILTLGYVISVLFFLWLGSWVDLPNKPSCSYYGIKITSHANGAVVGGTVDLSGTYNKVPPTGSLILMVKSPNGSEYWPSSNPVTVTEASQKWSGRIFIAGDPPVKQDIVAALVGKSGRALFEYYLKVGQLTNQWNSINSLTEDIMICDRVSVEKR